VQKDLTTYSTNRGQRTGGSTQEFFDEFSQAIGDPSDVDPTKVLGKIKTTSEPQFREYSINLAIMRHFLAIVPKSDRALREVLTERAIGYLHKYASFKSGAKLGWQSNPIQDGTREYVRFGTYPLMHHFRNNLAQRFALTSENLRVVSDRSFLGAVKSHLQSWDWHVVSDQKSPSKRNADTISQVVGHLEFGESDPLFIDCSASIAQLFDASASHPDQLGPAIDTFQQGIRIKLQEEVNRKVDAEHAKLSTQEKRAKIKKLIESVEHRLLVGGILDTGGLTLFYSSKLAGRDNDRGLDRAASARSNRLDSEQESIFKALSEEGGFTLDPVQLLECWAKMQPDTSEILSSVGLKEPIVKFLSSGASLAKFKDIDQFLEHPFIRAFESLSIPVDDQVVPPPYLAILPKATVNLLRGLRDLHVDQAFTAENGLNLLLQLSLNRMLVAMRNVVDAKDDFRQFQNQIHLLHEEIGTLLAVAKPYRAPDVDHVLRNATRFIPDGVFHDNLQHYCLMNSGMRCLATVIDSCQRQKSAAPHANRELNVAIEKDIYYESTSLLKEGRDRHLFVYDSEKGSEGATSEIESEMWGDQKLIYLSLSFTKIPPLDRSKPISRKI
jgi:hypothetical protein